MPAWITQIENTWTCIKTEFEDSRQNRTKSGGENPPHSGFLGLEKRQPEQHYSDKRQQHHCFAELCHGAQPKRQADGRANQNVSTSGWVIAPKLSACDS